MTIADYAGPSQGRIWISDFDGKSGWLTDDGWYIPDFTYYAGITNGAAFIGRGIPLAPFHQRPWRVRDADLCLRTRKAPRRLS